MVYGQFQYYNDELNGWNRVIAMHKEALHESLRLLSLLLNQNTPALNSPDAGDSSNTSGTAEKEGNAFTDQLMVQEQQFDHITHQITSQRQRLDRTASHPGKPIEHHVCQQQDSLRTKMQSTERSFIRTKYTCSIFLSSFLNRLATTLHRKPYVQIQ